jgi:hypothetical protein
MDLKIVEEAGKIAGLGGLALAVFLLLFMAVIKNTRLFSRMTADQTFKIVRQFLYLTFVIAALGLGAWVYARAADAKPPGPPPPKEVSFVGQELTPERLPPAMMEPPNNGSADTLVGELSARGSLTLDHSTLTLAGLGANVTVSLSVHTLTLINGARIVTNGNGFRLQAVRIIVSNGSLLSFADKDLTPPDAAPGVGGKDGLNGGEVLLRAESGIAGALRVFLPGQNGGRGGPGPGGAQGQPGNRGSNGVQGLVDCRSGGGDGGTGGQGLPGGVGAKGGNAGNGGNVVLAGKLATLAASIQFDAPKGNFGPGGLGGPGGPGGPGGQGGSGTASCSGGHGGAQGPPGPAGPAGPHGDEGKPGAMKPQQ